MGGYDEWWNEYDDFRKSIGAYTKLIFGATYKIFPTILEDGNLIDHHIISYLAPMSFKAKGWNGMYLTPSEHLSLFANYFIEKGIRFIYVPLPNKGVIYPSVISKVDCNSSYNSPQWRKYIHSILNQSPGIEIIDGFDILNRNKASYNVFSKGHHISSIGANIIASELAEYLLKSTNDIKPQLELYRKIELYKYYDWDYISKDHLYSEELVIHYDKKSDKPFYATDFSKTSKIGIIGDCNIQHYQTHAASLVTSLSYYTNYNFDEVGRYLPFDWVSSVTTDILDRLCEKEIVIYIAFASASFVRSRLFSRRRLGKPNTWSDIKLV